VEPFLRPGALLPPVATIPRVIYEYIRWPNISNAVSTRPEQEAPPLQLAAAACADRLAAIAGSDTGRTHFLGAGADVVRLTVVLLDGRPYGRQVSHRRGYVAANPRVSPGLPISDPAVDINV
jgi:hypothetical protein